MGIPNAGPSPLHLTVETGTGKKVDSSLTADTKKGLTEPVVVNGVKVFVAPEQANVINAELKKVKDAADPGGSASARSSAHSPTLVVKRADFEAVFGRSVEENEALVKQAAKVDSKVAEIYPQLSLAQQGELGGKVEKALKEKKPT